MMPTEPSRGVLVTLVLGTSFGFVACAVLGAGGWEAFFSQPARGAAALVVLVAAAATCFTEVNASAGVRAGTNDGWLVLVVLVATPVLAWFPAWSERRGNGVIDGDVVRWAGVALLAAGGVLRVWPMFLLGRRFSALVAIQPGHTLVTTGAYRFVRHPSYLGALVALAGWALVFRSGPGLLALLPAPVLTATRIEAEEAVLAANFGDTYDAYRRTTRWRLLPGLY